VAILDPVALYQSCGPWVATETTAAVVTAESGGHPYAFHTPEGPYYAPDLPAAVRFLAAALRRWPSVDIGLMQINSRWIARANIRPESLLDPCTNVRLGTSILAANYGAAARHSKTPLEALIRALSAYNSGSESRSLGYAYRVIVKPLDPRTASTLQITFGTAEGNPTGRALDPRTASVFFPSQTPPQ
jgi:type IV secretion system protein VirB1